MCQSHEQGWPTLSPPPRRNFDLIILCRFHAIFQLYPGYYLMLHHHLYTWGTSRQEVAVFGAPALDDNSSVETEIVLNMYSSVPETMFASSSPASTAPLKYCAMGRKDS